MRLQGSPWLPCLGCEKAARFVTWPWPSRNEGDVIAMPWGAMAVSILCHAPRAWVPFIFFPLLWHIAASLWTLPLHCCSQSRLGLLICAKAELQQGPSFSGGLAGVPRAGSLQCGSCAVIRAAPDKSRAGISPWGWPGPCQNDTRRSSPGLLAAVGLKTTSLNSPCAPLSVRM